VELLAFQRLQFVELKIFQNVSWLGAGPSVRMYMSVGTDMAQCTCLSLLIWHNVHVCRYWYGTMYMSVGTDMAQCTCLSLL